MIDDSILILYVLNQPHSLLNRTFVNSLKAWRRLRRRSCGRCLLLATTPDVQEAVRAEILETIGNERLPALADRARLLYTEAVICEVQRFGSIVPMALAHVASRDPQVLGTRCAASDPLLEC